MLDWINESENGFFSVEALALDPQNANNVYMLCGTSYINNGRTAILKSTDKGNTFTDACVTWNQAWSDVTTTTNGNGICFVHFDPASSVVGGATQTMYIGVSRIGSANLYKSTDGGATFTDISATTSFMPHRAALRGSTMYVSYSDKEGPVSDGFGKLYKLTFHRTDLIQKSEVIMRKHPLLF